MIDEREILRRRDMRDVFTFTIDPADAKDFDDAISFVEVKEDRDHEITGSQDHEKLYQIGVHIADVSHYVKPGTKTDDDAYKRGTSTYLVDRVIPMLPEELCNDLCSLRPGEDKLCMSIVFLMDADARVLKYKICRTVIRSDARLNYDEVQEMLQGVDIPEYRDTEIPKVLKKLDTLAQANCQRSPHDRTGRDAVPSGRTLPSDRHLFRVAQRSPSSDRGVHAAR